MQKNYSEIVLHLMHGAPFAPHDPRNCIVKLERFHLAPLLCITFWSQRDVGGGITYSRR